MFQVHVYPEKFKMPSSSPYFFGKEKTLEANFEGMFGLAVIHVYYARLRSPVYHKPFLSLVLSPDYVVGDE